LLGGCGVAPLDRREDMGDVAHWASSSAETDPFLPRNRVSLAKQDTLGLVSLRIDQYSRKQRRAEDRGRAIRPT
jgi:hypothetical protein